MSESKKTRMQSIVDEDSQRASLEEWRRIRLYRENGFLRAYNRSCWLQHVFFPELKVQHRVLAGCAEPVTYIGFPDRSMGRFCPEGAEVVTNDDGTLCVVLPTGAGLPSADVVSLEESFSAWKASVPVVEREKPKKMDKKDFLPDQGDGQVAPMQRTARQRPERASFSGIAQEILAFSIESHSPIECMLFLQKIKEKYASLY